MVLYAEGVDGFVRNTLPAIEGALAADEPVLVLAGGERIALLKEALGDQAERVGLADTRLLARNPARLIPAWRQFLAEQSPNGDHALGVSEAIWSGRTAAEITECELHESLLDLAFADGQPWRLLCPYDVDGLEDQVIESAQRGHAFLAHGDDSESNGAYQHAHAPPRPFAGALPAPLMTPQRLAFTGEDLGAVRHFLSRWAAQEKLDAEGTEELVLAVNELTTNSIRYGGGHGELSIWREADTLLCEVRDDGHITDPLVGRSRPTPEENNGRGLWLANQLCDLVQIRSSAQGSTVRVHKALT
jgi:anti-sigma regulatory factor (Ser/Thr protein kinase)